MVSFSVLVRRATANQKFGQTGAQFEITTKHGNCAHAVADQTNCLQARHCPAAHYLEITRPPPSNGEPAGERQVFYAAK